MPYTVIFCLKPKSNNFPQRGTVRDDIRPGLRITQHKKCAILAFG
jgi:plasmid stabilization system protein ParE